MRRCSASASAWRCFANQVEDVDADVRHHARRSPARRRRRPRTARDRTSAADPPNTTKSSGVRAIVSASCTRSVFDSFMPMMFAWAARRSTVVWQEIDAGEHADVVEQHRHRGRIRHGRVVTARTRRSSSRSCRRKAYARARRPRRYARRVWRPRWSLPSTRAHPANQRAVARHVGTHRLDNRIRLRRRRAAALRRSIRARRALPAASASSA